MLVVITVDMDRDVYNELSRLPTDLHKDGVKAALDHFLTSVRDIDRHSTFTSTWLNEGKNQTHNAVIRQITTTEEGQALIAEFLESLRG